MDWMMRPKRHDFRSLAEYSEWLASHSDEIPEAGQVLIFRIHAEDFFWLKIGTGKTKISDLPTLQ